MTLLAALAVFSSSQVQANESSEYKKNTQDTFHSLFDHHSFRPFLNCSGKERACAEILAKIANGEFKFLAPLEHADEISKLPTLASMRRRCPGIGAVHLQYLGAPLGPTSAFALYRVPSQASPRKSETVYLARSEDYRNEQGLIQDDGAFSVFTYPGCKRLKEVTFKKTRPSSYTPDAPGQERASLAEPIVIQGRVLFMIIYAVNESAPKEPPLYSIVLWSVVGNSRSGGELYSFQGR